MARSRRITVVLGMHRSGTSAVTRVMSLLGASLPSNLMPPLEHINEAGFWESEEVVRLNDAMLAAAGSSWDDMGPMRAAWFDSAAAQPFRHQAAALLREELKEHRLIVLKDPRLCRLMPTWRQAITDAGAKPGYILVLRNPLEVAESVRRRDGFPPFKSLLLWLRHVLEAERSTRGEPRSFVTYADLLEDWRPIAARVSRELGLRWPRSPREAAADIDGFLSGALRHHSFGEADLARREVPRIVRDVHGALTSCGERPSRTTTRNLDARFAELERADGVFAEVLAEVERSLRTEHRSRIELSRFHEALTDGERRLEAVLAERDAGAETHRQQSAELEARVASLAAEVAARDLELRRLEDRAAAQDLELKRLAEVAAARDLESRRLEGLVDTRDFEIRRLERRVAALDSMLGQAEAQHRSHCAAILGALDAADA